LAGLLILAACAVLLLSAGAALSGVSAAPLPQTADEGKAIFDEKCAGCHSLGGGRLVGPDLSGVTDLRDEQWLKDFITNPARMVETDPDAQALFEEYNSLMMPAMGLTPPELEAVLVYLHDPQAAAGAPAAPAALPGEGSAAAGQLLFTGQTGLANGGMPCIACHTVQGAGGLGGALGPDLTHAVGRMSEPGLAASLNNIVFPTMVGPFANRPLTVAEQADLIAFLREANRSQAPVPNTAAGVLNGATLLMLAIGLAGAGLLFGVLLIFWTGLKRRMALRLPVRKV